jgi:hypothetical protein
MARSMTKTTAAKKEEAIKAEALKTAATRKTEPVVKKREFKETDGILCRSVTPGGLYMIGKKTGMLYEWNAYGHEYEVEYRDLVIAVRTRSDFVFGPLFIIEDQDFIDEFPIVQKFYDESYTDSDLKDIIKLPVDEMKKAIDALPPRAKENFKSIASTAVDNGTLDSIEKIRVIDEQFGLNLKVLTK